MRKTQLSAQAGEYHWVKKPVISFTPNGKLTYIWVGNNETGNKLCFATVSGHKRLEKFAKALLKALKHQPKKKPTKKRK